MNKFSSLDNEIKEIQEAGVIRTIEIAIGHDLSEQEKIDFKDNPQIITQIYQERLGQPAHKQLINVVQDLEERHQDIKKLETHILKMHSMIKEINKLVQYQGEILDNIVDNVSKARDYIENANKRLNKGKCCMECTHEIKCVIAWIVVIGLLIILIPIIVKFF